MRKDHEKVILTDVDGVLLSWGYAFDVWMKQHGHEKIKDVYTVSDAYGITREAGKRLTRQFNESAVIGFLPPLRDAIHYVRLLHEKYGYVFHAITSLSLDPHAGELRTMCLKKLFGETAFEKFVYLDTGADKDEALLPYKDTGFLWVEDKVENALVGDNLGLDSVVMEHGYNMNDCELPLMKGWKDIVEYLEG